MFTTKKKQRDWLLQMIAIGETAAARAMALPRHRCLEIYSAISGFDWVEDLGEKPIGWGKMTYQEKDFVLGSAIRVIEDRISDKERKRYERMLKYGETPAQFEDWWESRIVRLLEQLVCKVI